MVWQPKPNSLYILSQGETGEGRRKEGKAYEIKRWLSALNSNRATFLVALGLQYNIPFTIQLTLFRQRNISTSTGEPNMKLRLFHRLYAFFCGYFWLPCPICGREFGGHEKNGYLMDDPFGGRMVCSNCKKEAEHRNKQLYDSKEFIQAFSAHYSEVFKKSFGNL